MINRKDVLIKRAASTGNLNPYSVDFEKSDIEYFGNTEYLVIRDNADILSVFLIYEWQVEALEPEDWPDYLLDEAAEVEA